MKNISLYTLLLAVTFITFTACGESEAERQAREQARLDSLRQIELQKVAEMMATIEDSTNAAIEAEPTEGSASSISEEGSYVIQVGSWRSEEKAQSFVDKWADRNYPSAYIIKTGNEETGDVWFRVRIGYFDTQESAREFGATLAAEINTGFWVANKD